MSDFVMRSGKHEGKTLDWVKKNDLSYLMWVKENQPRMLEPTKQKAEPKPVGPRIEPPEKSDSPKSGAMKPNLNFLNEKSNHPEEAIDSNPPL